MLKPTLKQLKITGLNHFHSHLLSIKLTMQHGLIPVIYWSSRPNRLQDPYLATSNRMANGNVHNQECIMHMVQYQNLVLSI